MLYANALEYDYRIINIPFWQHAAKFPYLERDGLIKVTMGNIFVNKAVKRVLAQFVSKKTGRILSKKGLFLRYQQTEMESGIEFFDLRNEDYLVSAKRGIAAFFGWFFEDLQSWYGHSDEIRRAFRPDEVTQKQAKAIFDGIGPSTKIVGIHIRRGDYRTAYNGKYCFDNEEWSGIICSLNHQFKKCNESVVFLICSDEEVALDVPDEIDIIYSRENAYVDLDLLSKCDLLVGVMSTFVCWASFMGQVPLIVTEEPEAVSMSDARVCTGYLPNKPLFA